MPLLLALYPLFCLDNQPIRFFIMTHYANRGKLLHPAINLLYDNDSYIAGWIFFLPDIHICIRVIHFRVTQNCKILGNRIL